MQKSQTRNEVNQGEIMSLVTTLGGYSIDAAGVRHQLPVILNPSNLITEKSIERVSCAGRGVVVLKNTPSPEIGPEKLELYVDSGNFLLMLGVNDEDGDYCVRTITNETMSNDLIAIMGEKYPATAVTRDIDLVRAAFSEFAQSGDVRGCR